MTYNSYSLQYYSFRKGKIGFGFLKHADRDCFLDNANSHQALQLTVDSFQKRIFAVQITDNSFGKEKNREDSVIVPTHYLLLEKLLIDCNVLIINIPRKRKQTKETNWKQKFQKPQNENICLTNLNMEMDGNFPMLSFDYCFDCY